MQAHEINELKTKLKKELLRRDGLGSVAMYGSDKYDFDEIPVEGSGIKAEHGEKTVDLLLQITDYKDLRYTNMGEAIPQAFNGELIDVVDKLSQEERTGESEYTVSKHFPDRKPEQSSCRGACTGLCVGSCVGFCNGCTSCSGCSTTNTSTSSSSSSSSSSTVAGIGI